MAGRGLAEILRLVGDGIVAEAVEGTEHLDAVLQHLYRTFRQTGWRRRDRRGGSDDSGDARCVDLARVAVVLIRRVGAGDRERPVWPSTGRSFDVRVRFPASTDSDYSACGLLTSPSTESFVGSDRGRDQVLTMVAAAVDGVAGAVSAVTVRAVVTLERGAAERHLKRARKYRRVGHG
jgi:hypothetical protein